MTHNMRALLFLGAAVTVLTGCESAEAKRERNAVAARARVATESARAFEAVAVPLSAVWNDAQLVKRLVDAGLAPQRRDSVKALVWMGAPVLAYRLGVSTIDVYVYRDSVARKAVVATLDPSTFAPRGTPSPWGVGHDLIENNNLIAVVVGGTDRQRERIATALAAGAGAP